MSNPTEIHKCNVVVHHELDSYYDPELKKGSYVISFPFIIFVILLSCCSSFILCSVMSRLYSATKTIDTLFITICFICMICLIIFIFSIYEYDVKIQKHIELKKKGRPCLLVDKKKVIVSDSQTDDYNILKYKLIDNLYEQPSTTVSNVDVHKIDEEHPDYYLD